MLNNDKATRTGASRAGGKTMKKVFGSLTLVGLLMGGSLHYAYAHSEDSFVAPFGVPVIDGVQSSGEWDSAVQIPVFTLIPSTLFIMRDDSNLYLALRVPDSALTDDDVFEIRFDNDHDGVDTDGDDNLFLNGADLFQDDHFVAGTGYGIPDSQQDGTGSAGRGGDVEFGFSFFEIAHPLDSGDVNDIAFGPGTTLGFCVRYFDAGTSFSPGLTFPANCVLAVNQQNLYADLTFGTVPNRIFADCTFDLLALRDAIDWGGNPANPSPFPAELEASYILIYDRKNPNDGQRINVEPPFEFTGPVLCTNSGEVEITATTETTAIPNSTNHPGAASIDVLGSEEALHLQYQLNDVEGEPIFDGIEKRVCHSVADNVDCFFIQPVSD